MVAEIAWAGQHPWGSVAGDCFVFQFDANVDAKKENVPFFTKRPPLATAAC